MTGTLAQVIALATLVVVGCLDWALAQVQAWVQDVGQELVVEHASRQVLSPVPVSGVGSPPGIAGASVGTRPWYSSEHWPSLAPLARQLDTEPQARTAGSLLEVVRRFQDQIGRAHV